MNERRLRNQPQYDEEDECVLCLVLTFAFCSQNSQFDSQCKSE
jgi:hypothetical protein